MLPHDRWRNILAECFIGGQFLERMLNLYATEGELSKGGGDPN